MIETIFILSLLFCIWSSKQQKKWRAELVRISKEYESFDWPIREKTTEPLRPTKKVLLLDCGGWINDYGDCIRLVDPNGEDVGYNYESIEDAIIESEVLGFESAKPEKNKIHNIRFVR